MKVNLLLQRLQSRRTVAIYTIVVTFLAVVMFSIFRFNLGTELTTSNLIIFSSRENTYFDQVEEFVTSDGAMELKEIPGNKYEVYYRNKSLEDLSNKKRAYEEKLGELQEFEVYAYEPAEIFFVQQRITYGIYFATLTYIVFLIYAYKGLNIVRRNAIKLILTDIVINVWHVILGLGFVGLASAMGVVMNEFFFIGIFAAFLIALSINVFVIMNFYDVYANGQSIASLDNYNQAMVDKLQAFVVFISLLVVIPFCFLAGNFLSLVPIFLVFPLLSAFNNLVVRFYITKDIEWLLDRFGMLPNANFFQKEL